MNINGWMYPVFDHNIVDTQTSGNITMGHVDFPTWGGYNYEIGNGSWAEPSYWGSEKFAFFEDNTIFNHHPTNIVNGALDCEAGGRYVFRYNIVTGTWPGQHGTETGAYRGGRAHEIYGNSFTYPSTMSLSGNLRRSGTGLVYGNSISAPNYNLHMMSPTVFRRMVLDGWLGLRMERLFGISTTRPIKQAMDTAVALEGCMPPARQQAEAVSLT